MDVILVWKDLAGQGKMQEVQNVESLPQSQYNCILSLLNYGL